uniref:Ubiquitin-like protease family profile domain-containing protein n=1 Tax=Globisporangium ultimum (strain ATCC 200006 / CBS 805.95 / DAOM BR144) TaxID=431595 RepID=K3WTS6_GLOUD
MLLRASVPKVLTRSKVAPSNRRVSLTGDERKRMQFYLLQSAFSSEDDKIDETSWLTSTLMDLILWRLANLYPNVHFLPTDFFHCHLEGVSRNYHHHYPRHHAPYMVNRANEESDFHVRDVLGRAVDYKSNQPILFAVNIGLIHWNLFRVQLTPHPELQLFEPMGRLASRTGISYRSIPRSVIEWLETCYPQHKNWISKAVSAITKPQQVSGFDCGVACLLYADKCGQGQTHQQINERTDQHAITSFRHTLQSQLRSMQSNMNSVSSGDASAHSDFSLPI